MKIDFTKGFNKQFEKLPQQRQEKAKDVIALYLKAPSTVSLRLHALKGEWKGHLSISAGGDLRVHLKIIGEDTILFVAVGSHSQLYK